MGQLDQLSVGSTGDGMNGWMKIGYIIIVLTMICSGVFSVRLYMWYALTWVENSLDTAAIQEVRNSLK